MTMRRGYREKEMCHGSIETKPNPPEALLEDK